MAKKKHKQKEPEFIDMNKPIERTKAQMRQDKLIQRTRGKDVTRDDIVIMYVECIKDNQLGFHTNWEAIHKAIHKRWSKSTVNYINTEARKKLGMTGPGQNWM